MTSSFLVMIYSLNDRVVRSSSNRVLLVFPGFFLPWLITQNFDSFHALSVLFDTLWAYDRKFRLGRLFGEKE